MNHDRHHVSYLEVGGSSINNNNEAWLLQFTTAFDTYIPSAAINGCSAQKTKSGRIGENKNSHRKPNKCQVMGLD